MINNDPTTIIEERPCIECNSCREAEDLGTRLIVMKRCAGSKIKATPKTNIITNFNGEPINEKHILLKLKPLDGTIIKITSIPTIYKGKPAFRGIKIISKKSDLIPLEACLQLSKFYHGHDIETHEHNLRVGLLSHKIGSLLFKNKNYKSEFLRKYLNEYKKINEINENSYLNRILCAGILHDIGKVFIPSEILNKKGQLTPQEFRIIKKHIKYGYILLKDLFNFKLSPNVALLHHEQFSGNGYLGLKETQIPLGVNLISAADLYDAVRTDRPYRAAYNAETTKSLFLGKEQDSKGNFKGHLNPIILETILNNWDEINHHFEILTKLKTKELEFGSYNSMFTKYK